MLPFCSDAAAPPYTQPTGRARSTIKRFAGIIFLKSEKFNFTTCFHYSLKCTKFDVGWGSAPDPTGGAHRVPRKIIVWISKVFIPPNALYSSKMCQTRNIFGVRGSTPDHIRRAI